MGETGGGVWCLNSGLLKEEQFKKSIIKCIKEEEGSLFAEDECVWWEKVKLKRRV